MPTAAARSDGDASAPTSADTLYIVDFGLAEPARTVMGEAKPATENVRVGGQGEEELHPREQAVQEARVKRRVQKAVGKGAVERIVREKRQPKPRQLDTPEPAAAPRAKAEPKARYKKGQVVRVVEYVLRHRMDAEKGLEFKVKWKHLSVGESLALPWQPLSDFVETIGGVKYYNKAIDEYMTEHRLESDDEDT